MLDKLDATANRAASKVHLVVHKATGWSNFKSARVFLYAGIVCWMAWDLLNTKHHASGWDYLGTIITLVIDLALGYYLHHIFRVAEESWTKQTDILHLPFSPTTVRRLVLWRALWFYMGLFSLIVNPLIGEPARPGTILVSLSCYFCFQWQPPAKSMARRAVEGLKKAVSNIRIPSLLPPPIPVPA